MAVYNVRFPCTGHATRRTMAESNITSGHSSRSWRRSERRRRESRIGVLQSGRKCESGIFI